MRKLKYIGNKKEVWEKYFSPGTIYEAYNSVELEGVELVRNDFYVGLKLDSERLRRFEEVYD